VAISTLLKLLATVSAALFAGAALYISLVEQPARLLATMEVALGEFRPGFPRARTLQASLAILGSVCAGVLWWRGAGRAWLLAAVSLVAVVIFTLLILLPIYTALLDPALSPSAPDARVLLERWGRLHLVRTALGLVALFACVWSLAHE
jgi:Domain of unknown function (DUF1772)